MPAHLRCAVCAACEDCCEGHEDEFLEHDQLELFSDEDEFFYGWERELRPPMDVP